jgi:hypothetical protein
MPPHTAFTHLPTNKCVSAATAMYDKLANGFDPRTRTCARSNIVSGARRLARRHA